MPRGWVIAGAAAASLIGCQPQAAVDTQAGPDPDQVHTGSVSAPCDPQDHDVYGDGVDANCDGIDGIDGDRDGWPAAQATMAGATADCDDADPDVHPDAPDEPGDAIDSNCDGADGIDRDGDGFLANASDPALVDCDDLHAQANPRMQERSPSVCDDGLDNDCNGQVDLDQVSCPRPAACEVTPPSCTDAAPFAEVTTCAGSLASHGGPINSHYGTGQAWGDVDGDGWLDLYVTHNTSTNSLFRNNGDGTFSLFPFALSVALRSSDSLGATFVDYDNDGWQDLYVMNNGANVMFHNDGGTGFTDVTVALRLGDTGKGETAAWGDFDNDGDLDVYLTNWFCSCNELTGHMDRLLRNDGTLFTDITHILPRNITTGAGFSASWFDADDDGDVDLYVVNDKGNHGADSQLPTHRNVLHRNDGPGCGGWCFVDIGVATGADLRLNGMGLAVGDLDGDLDLDLGVSDTGPASLLRREAHGVYTETSTDAGINQGGNGWGISFLDFDNDGDLDVTVPVGAMVTTGGVTMLFEGAGDGTFTERPNHGLSTGAHQYGMAVADYDRDGWLDAVMGNATLYTLHRNASGACLTNGWFRLRLVGGGPVNREAAGTKVFLTRTDGTVIRQDVIIGTGLGAGHDPALHFGLSDADVAQVEVRWPDGTIEVLTDLPSNQEWVHAYPAAP